MFLSFFIRVAAIFCMIGFGILAKKLKLINSDATTQLSRLVTFFFLPSLIFSSLVENFTPRTLLANWSLPAGSMLILITGYLVGVLFVHLLKFNDRRRKNQFVFQSTVNNYSFLPLPIVLMLWGDEGVARLLFSTLGSELVLWTLGVFVLTGNKLRRDSLKHLLSVPIMAIFAAVLVIFLRTFFGNPGAGIFAETFLPDAFAAFIDMLSIFGGATIPLAMFLAGSRGADLKPKHFFTLHQTALVILRLLVIPAVAAGILYALPFPWELKRILLVVAVMPSAITSVMISEVYGSDTDFAASSVLTTQLCSIITIPIWLTLFFG